MTQQLLKPRPIAATPSAGAFRGEMRKAARSVSLVLLAWFALVMSGVTAYGYAVIGADTGEAPELVVDDVVRAWMMTFLFSGIFAALYIGREFDSRVINRTLLLTGTRARVLTTKLAVTTLSGVFFALLAGIGAVASALILPALVGLDTAWSDEVTWTLLGVMACCVLSAWWGGAIALCVRRQIVAVLVVVGFCLLIDPGLQRIWPDAANGLFTIALSSLYLDPKPDLLPVPAAALVAIAWVLAPAAFGAWRFLRKDLP